MRILVTGGAGFIGHHLCNRLLNEGHDVIALDDLSTGSASNVDRLRSPDRRFHFIRGDILRADQPWQVEPGRIDQVYHLACPASPKQYQEDPVRTTRVAVGGTLNVLNFAKHVNARFLLASTSEVYGDPPAAELPLRETYRGAVNCMGPRACYDEGKRCAESLTFDFMRKHGLDVRVARIFNTYGPRMARNDGRVIPNFIHAALEGRPLTIFGDGSQTRSFCYVDDLVDGLMRLMNAERADEPVNLGSREQVTIRDLARIVCILCHSDSEVIYSPLPQDDPRDRCPDLTRAHNLFGYKPTVHLETGLTQTIHDAIHEGHARL